MLNKCLCTYFDEFKFKAGKQVIYSNTKIRKCYLLLVLIWRKNGCNDQVTRSYATVKMLFHSNYFLPNM